MAELKHMTSATLTRADVRKFRSKTHRGKHEKPQTGSYGRPKTGVPACRKHWLSLLQTDQSDNWIFVCSHEGPVGENHPPVTTYTVTKQCFRHAHRAHLQYFFIVQDGGETVPKGHGPEQQDIKQVHLLFSGNLDEQRPV